MPQLVAQNHSSIVLDTASKGWIGQFCQVLNQISFLSFSVFNFEMTREKIFSVSLDYGMTALVAIISGQLQVSLQILMVNVWGRGKKEPITVYASTCENSSA